MITVLAGGVGAARFLRGLVDVVDAQEITAVVNTADDFVLHGLHISPDLDTVMYTLASDVGPQGWGRADESRRAMDELHRYQLHAPEDSEATDWFMLGDRDLATHLYRTQRLAEGADLSQVTRELSEALDVRVSLIPMTDDPVATSLTLTNGECVTFQEYFVKRQHNVAVSNVVYEGAATAKPSLEALAAIENADRLIIAPSNPILSIAPILAIDEIARAVRERRDDCTAVSPLIGGRAIKGPADHLLVELGHESTVAGIAKLWSVCASSLIIDAADSSLADEVERAGMAAIVTQALMTNNDAAQNLARAAVFSRS